MMKKLVSLFLVAITLFLVACGSKDPGDRTVPGPDVSGSSSYVEGSAVGGSNSSLIEQAVLPTAEELIDSGALDAVSKMDVVLDMQVSTVFELDSEDAISGFGSDMSDLDTGVSSDTSSTAMSAGMSAKIRMEKDGSLSHNKGSIVMVMFGQSFDMGLDQWLVDNGDGTSTVYTYNEDTAEWTYSVADKSDADELAAVSTLKSSMFKDLTVKSTADAYIVTGQVSFSELEGLGLDDTMDSLEPGVGLKDVFVDVEMQYSKDTRLLRRMAVSVNPDSLGDALQDGISDLVYTITLTVNSVGETELKLPSNVLDAKEENILDWADMEVD